MAAEVRTQYADHPEWGDEVLRNNDDSVKHPMEINLFMAWLLGAICFVGLALNFEIIIRILYDRTMHTEATVHHSTGCRFLRCLHSIGHCHCGFSFLFRTK